MKTDIDKSATSTHSELSHPLVDLSCSDLSIEHLKTEIAQFKQQQEESFHQGANVEYLISQRSQFIDQLLTALWRHFSLNTLPELTLIPVGGYGREVLHPLSDIDILLLHRQPLSEDQQQKISAFMRYLWDLKLDVGHSVRTLEKTIEQGLEDLSTATNLLEARYLIGDLSLFQQLKNEISKSSFWPSHLFFKAKCIEQEKRHQHYHSTSYNLEPDLKNGPGGLRDIETLMWIARRHSAAENITDMVSTGFISAAEAKQLQQAQHHLWRLRFALHLQLKRADNRLSFDKQRSVAKNLGYQGDGNDDVEAMMRDFYRTTRHITELNTLLLQLFDETVISPIKHHRVLPLTTEFQLRHNHHSDSEQVILESINPLLFKQQPLMILSLFTLMTRHNEITKISAQTLRALTEALNTLERPLVLNPDARPLFIGLLRQPNVISRALLPMHQYNVLAAYLPLWRNIVGQMQFDLFHAYTVDEHTLRLLMKLESFRLTEMQEKHPLCHQLSSKIAKPEILIIAALFHDIAKGRGGDHGELGALDAYNFAIEHGLSPQDAQQISQLVKHHLLMSITATRRDIQDPHVIEHICQQVGSKEQLDRLLCLTVADICATNENLWNDFKKSLLTELYVRSKKQLQQGSSKDKTLRAQVRDQRQEAIEILINSAKLGLAKDDFISPLNGLWRRCRIDYFLRHQPEQLAWHATALLKHDDDTPLILLREQEKHQATELFIACEDRAHLFATVAGELERRNLNIINAQIFTSKDNRAMDTFIVLQGDGQPISTDRYADIKQALYQAVSNTHYQPARIRKAPESLRHFEVAPQIKFISSQQHFVTQLEITALDRPGLLANIAEVFAQQHLSLLGARIVTTGERAEDLFILQTQERQRLNTTQKNTLLKQLYATLG